MPMDSGALLTLVNMCLQIQFFRKQSKRKGKESGHAVSVEDSSNWMS